jgi:hypothetical protein
MMSGRSKVQKGMIRQVIANGSRGFVAMFESGDKPQMMKSDRMTRKHKKKRQTLVAIRRACLELSCSSNALVMNSGSRRFQIMVKKG